MTYFPSIFNDVIGPIMRGPSSSHCAAAVRIGRIARDLMNSEISKVIWNLIKMDPWPPPMRARDLIWVYLGVAWVGSYR